MILQLPWVEFVLVIFCINGSLIPYATCKYVKCMLNGEDNQKCHCQEIQVNETPWPKRDARTAPMPKNASMKMKSTNGKLFPKIRWSLQKQYLEDVDGFYMQVWMLPNFYKYYYCVHNTSMILKSPQKKSLVWYEFQGCCRSLYKGFVDGDRLVVDIFSLPMYNIDETSHRASASLTVNDPYEIETTEDIETTQPDPPEYSDRDDTLEQIQRTLKNFENKYLQKNDSPITNIVTVIVAIVVTIVLCTLGICCMLACLHRKHLDSPHAKIIRRVLLIGDEDECCIKLVNGFIEIMKKSSNAGVDVVSNIRRTSEIASTGIVSWTTENFNQSDIVIMLISNPSQVNSVFAVKEEDGELKNSPVNVALNVAESEAAKRNFRILKKKFVLVHVHLRETKSLPFCSNYNLKKHFKEMLKHVLGHSYDSSVDVKEDCDHLLEIGKEIDVDAVKKCDDVGKKTTNINNLDVSLSAHQVALTSDVNDFSMVNQNADSNYASVENNERVV